MVRTAKHFREELLSSKKLADAFLADPEKVVKQYHLSLSPNSLRALKAAVVKIRRGMGGVAQWGEGDKVDPHGSGSRL